MSRRISLFLLCAVVAGCRPTPVPLVGLRDAAAPRPVATPAPDSAPPAPPASPLAPMPELPALPSAVPVVAAQIPTPTRGDEGGAPAPSPTVETGPEPVPAEPSGGPVPLVALPPPPLLTERGRTLLHQFEVGGGRAYYERFLARPTWPEAASGVTIGIGYDLGYNSREVILADWSALPARERQRLADCAGVKGPAAKARAAAVRDIVIPWALASEVFERVTVTRFHQLCRRTWPGFLALRPEARDSLLSLTFNRGSSMVGAKRSHMRQIRDLSPRADYLGMARQEELMVVVWSGTSIEQGMRRRRFAEAGLMRTNLPSSLDDL